MPRTKRLLAAIALSTLAIQPLAAKTSWPLWDSYTAYFLDASGRVVDHDAADRTTSEGQSYALFFSLVGNDRAKFDRILSWTQANLAHGDLATHLPAWLWGRQLDTWEVIDKNSAADADLWIAYTLLEAGQHWHDASLTTLGQGLANTIMQREVVDIPGLGFMLLPGPVGFKTSDGWYQLNPSYLPVQVLLGIASYTSDARWLQIAERVPTVLEGSCAKGFILDWIAYRRDSGFSAQPSPAAVRASYDAIRVYLWTGMLAPTTPGRAKMLAAVSEMASYVDQYGIPPASVSESGVVEDARGSAGFSAAVIPLLVARNRTKALEQQTRRLQVEMNGRTGLYGKSPRYYDQNLVLFALGWRDDRFNFDEHGRLRVSWK